jgi:hypothetical protein
MDKIWSLFSGNSNILKFLLSPARFPKCLGVCVPLRPPRKKKALYLPQVTLAMYQKEIHYSGVKVFNHLPRTLEDISSKPSKFKIALKDLMQTH